MPRTRKSRGWSARNRVAYRSKPARATKQPAARRTVGQIFVFGPKNDEEKRRLEDYLRKERAFLEQHFHYYLSDRLLATALNLALSSLAIVRSEYRHAILTQHREGSQLLLAKVVRRANELIESGEAGSRAVSPRPRRTQCVGARSCQNCGNFLADVCYSTIRNRAKRVPRTGKICAACFSALPTSEKRQYTRYRYKSGPQPRGTGWKPEGEWGK
jgi:hypothetical protein